MFSEDDVFIGDSVVSVLESESLMVNDMGNL